MIYEYLNKIKEFFIWFCDLEIHNEIWDELGPI
uniref:Uncharacterized protein n=1 Tax=viral metagenome TaxID=1070528 RepID=A0A6C0C524_9ZZZZ